MLLEAVGLGDHTTGIVIGVASLTLAYIIYKSKQKADPSAPPCIPSLPVIGSLTYLPCHPHEYHEFFMKKSKELGPVFSFQAGSRYTVVVNGYDAINEALVKRGGDFADRAPMFAERNVWNTGLHGMLSKRYDESYKNYRHLSLSILKEFGFGNPAVMEARVLTEVENFLKALRATDGKPVYPKPLISFALLNTVSGMLLAHTFDGLDSTLEEFIKQAATFLDQLDPVLDISPAVQYLRPSYRKLINGMPAVRDALMGTVKVLLQVGLDKKDSASYVRRFVEKEGEGYDKEELVYLLRDLANGGMQTTSIMIQWCLILIGNDKRVAEKLKDEIDSVIERGRLPSLEDRRKMPYMEATILEALRIRTLLPLALPHATTCQTQVAGYKIPEGAAVLLNMYSINMDENTWNNPEDFKPERFIDQDGKLVGKDKLVAFSLGKRSCPGEELGRAELFLYLTAVLQQFNIVPPEGDQRILDSPVIGRFYQPAQFKARFVPRQ